MAPEISRRGLRRLARVLVAAALVAAVGLTLPDRELLRVLSPRQGTVVGDAGVEVMVRYPREDRVEPGTLRVLLNGADATRDLTSGRNGAYGRLHGLLDGENVLRVEVFGRRWWLPGLLVEEAREVRFLVRLRHDWNRG